MVSSLRQSLSQATTVNEITSLKSTNEKDSAVPLGKQFVVLGSISADKQIKLQEMYDIKCSNQIQ